MGIAFCRDPCLPPNIPAELATDRPSLCPPHSADHTPRDICSFFLCPRNSTSSLLPHPPSLGPYHLASLILQSLLGGLLESIERKAKDMSSLLRRRHKVSESSEKTCSGCSRDINVCRLRPPLLALWGWYHYICFADLPGLEPWVLLFCLS